MDEAKVLALIDHIREESFARHLIYLRDGKPDAITVLPCPVTVLPDQLAYIHFVSLTIQNALKRLPELYKQDVSVRSALQLPPEEEKWLWDRPNRRSGRTMGMIVSSERSPEACV